MSNTRALFESFQQYLNEDEVLTEGMADIIKATIMNNKGKYGVKSVGGDEKKILVNTNNGSYWFVPVGDKIKISSAKGAQPVVRTERGKMQVPSVSIEVSGLFKDIISTTKAALDKLEPEVKDEYIVQIGDNYFGGYDENSEVILKADTHSATRYSNRDEADNVASQVGGEVIVESEQLNEDVGLKRFTSEQEIIDEFENAVKFVPDAIEYIGDGKAGNCKQNSLSARANDPESNPDVYLGYIVLKDAEGNVYGIRHYWNGAGEKAIEHTPVRDTALYNKGELIYYIGERI